MKKQELNDFLKDTNDDTYYQGSNKSEISEIEENNEEIVK